MSEFAEIEFRTFGGERHACLTGGMRIWKVVMVSQDYDMDVTKTAEHFELPAWKIQAALHYYEAFSPEIDTAIIDVRSQTFDTLKRQLPQLERHVVAKDVQ